jgi:hypothetical protein
MIEPLCSRISLRREVFDDCSICNGQLGPNKGRTKRFRMRELRICKKWNITGSKPLQDPGEGLRQRTQSQITSSLDVRRRRREESIHTKGRAKTMRAAVLVR